MSDYIHQSHNVTVVMYYFVFPAKYRRMAFYEDVDDLLKNVCLSIALSMFRRDFGCIVFYNRTTP